MRSFLLMSAIFLAGCATAVDIPQSKGQQLPTAGEHIPPPNFLKSEDQQYSSAPPPAKLCNNGQPVDPYTPCDEDRLTYTHYDIKDTCGKSGLGSTRFRPNACHANYAPVCGCNGVTYENFCTANSNGVSAMSKGECRA